MPYQIVLNPNIPVRDQLRGWRRITNFLVGWPVRGRVVIQDSATGKLYTNPENVDVVKRFLEQEGYAYEVVPQLQALRGGKE